MSAMKFSYKDTHVEIRSDRATAIRDAMVARRRELEAYIERHPEFRTALAPLSDLRPDAPDVARRMHLAARIVGVGPMAAVAGTLAQLAAEAGVAAGATEAIVENGGDLYLISGRTVVVGLFAGHAVLGGKLALRVRARDMPLAICSSSGRMGHSLSFGTADLATVSARDASLADAAATHACNLVQTTADIDRVLRHIAALPGIAGVLLVKDDRVGLAGRLPELVRNADPDIAAKITRDPGAEPLPSMP